MAILLGRGYEILDTTADKSKDAGANTVDNKPQIRGQHKADGRKQESRTEYNRTTGKEAAESTWETAEEEMVERRKASCSRQYHVSGRRG
jgi:hypothetical protein